MLGLSRRVSILVVAATLMLMLTLLLGGCGGAAHRRARTRSTRQVVVQGRACPGADPCPYSAVKILGRRGEGVLRFPEALAVAADGDVYVADQYSYVVQRFSSSGRFLGQWGSHGAGPGQFGAVGGLAVSRSGDVYLVDSEHDRVEEFDADGGLLRSWGSPGHALGQFEFGSGAPGSPPGGGIAVAHGYVYVADTGNDRIERFTAAGTEPQAWGERGSGPGQFNAPRGLAVHGEELYVADDGNDRIEELDTEGTYLRQVGAFGSGPGQFANPFGVAVGPSGTVYVADDNNHRVVVLTPRLSYVQAWALQAVQGESGGLHPNRGGEQVSYPRAIASSATGLVYVADAASNQIYEFGPTGGLLAAWGVSGRSYGQFILPEDLAATPSGGVLVADTLGGRLELFGGGQLAYSTSLRGGATILGDHLFKPVSLALGTDGSIWVTDQENNIVRHLSPEGELLGALGSASVSGAGETGGTAYFSSAARAAATTSTATAAATATSARAGAAQARAAARAQAARARAARLQSPGGVAIGRGGEIYVADTGEDLIKRYSPSGAPLGAWGGAGAQPGRFHGPLALAVDRRSGDVYVVDVGNDRIEKFTATGGYLGEWGGSGQAPGRFREPDGIAVDSRGAVFVADAGNDRIEEFDSHGRLLRMWGAPGAGAGELSGPAGLAVGCGGTLLVADTDNNRVQRFSGVAASGRCTAGSP